jgi:hypothetical protein
MKHQDRPEDTDFDLRARAELALAFEPGEPPAHLLRHTPWYARRGLHALCAAVMVGSVAAGSVLSLRPPQMVRSAIEHEYYERTLRGQFIPRPRLPGIWTGLPTRSCLAIPSSCGPAISTAVAPIT